jgi:hypothetical protein
MNYDLAIMALEGLARSPLEIKVGKGEITISAAPATFRDLARLCLLLGGDTVGGAEGFDLQPGVHVEKGSPELKLRLAE